MGTGDGAIEKTKHNPDVENLKSLLKKSNNKKDKKHNRVVFNETKNEFFDADYIILIREECDFEDEDDDGVCTCYQHEMVRLTCCEPDCSCGGVYEQQVENQTPQSPKFAPPIEFVDAVTLSPPEGYKDMELEELAYKQRKHRTAVCRECSANQEHLNEKGDTCQPNSDIIKPKIDLDDDEQEKEKIDQSQQTTPTSPNNPDGKEYLLESSVDEDQSFEENVKPLPTAESPVTGILKGGKLWRQQSGENLVKQEQFTKTDSISDEESNQRTVRFIEEEKKDSCKSSPETDREVEGKEATKEDEISPNKQEISNAEPTEMMLTFKLGNHVLISNNSLKPNSAVRQLFPCTKGLQPKTGENDDKQYLVTAESLKAFEEAKRAKLPQIIQNTGTTDNIKRVIERNTLRRSLVRYEPKSKKNLQKTDNSLVERIKQLTCDIDDVSQDSDDLSARVSPTGEEGSNNSDNNQISNKIKEPRNFSPSSSSTASSNSSTSSTYKKITDIFGKREKPLENSTQSVNYEPKTVQTQTLPDIGGPYNHDTSEKDSNKSKQFLSTLAPLTACVSGISHPDDHYYHLSNHGSVISSTGSEYTLDDIDEALVNEENKKITPDVLAGTPASESGDELLVFVQQDANRIERIKKKYENDSKKEDDENDDYGFNHRPSVRGIKPRFGSTTEILQQIQNQIQLPSTNANVSWPYYSETSLNRDDDSNRINKQNATTQYQNISDETKVRSYQYRPVSLHDSYQSCTNQNCYKDTYKTQVGMEIDCQAYPKYRNNRPLSPPPQELSKTYHQTMVYIPYNHIESYQQPNPNPYQTNEYYRYNQINKKYIEPVYQQKMTFIDDQYATTNGQHKFITKTPYMNSYQPMLVPSRSESPLMGNYSMARSTQTSVGCLSGCSFYQVPSTLRYKDSMRQPYKSDYKVQRHSFPAVRPRYNSGDASEHAYLDDTGMQHVNHLNGYYNYLPPKESPANSPTKARYIERGVPEGAASVSPQDSVNLQSTSTNTSPTTMTHNSSKPLFYAMNV
ncbi:uncharacterized protein LOC130891960 [Diorhabda carinulata]|uniref:uncharacterized protein LOC130891960 n=1 Tax=Diorhabda carinulata TaxID=1163345 RepID=UPI0025A171B8|nr:uncharacterized protein LOC130891960 [Diorhabda carinulata]XP_057653077.1 uncharacterized protein LOC130891960 [Diorhabda carinulata]